MKRFCTLALIVVCSAVGSQAYAQAPNLANTKWAGSENLGGFGTLEFQFQANGNVAMIDAKETSYGQWKLNQNNVTLSFYKDTVQYVGTIDGRDMMGSASNGKAKWTWNVKNQTPAVAPAPAPGPTTQKPLSGPISGPTSKSLPGPSAPAANFKLTPQNLPAYLQKAGYQPKVQTPEIGSPYCELHVSDADWNFIVEASVDTKGSLWLLMRLDQSSDLKAGKLMQLLEANNTMAPCFFVYRSEDTRICLKLECIGNVQGNMATLMRMTRESHSLWSVAAKTATK